MSIHYDLEKNKAYTTKLRALQKELPPLCSDFFRGIENTTSVLTRHGYAVDLKGFFLFLLSLPEEFQCNEMNDITIDVVGRIRPVHIEMYLEHTTYYRNGARERFNHERGKARKLSTLRSFLKYYYKKERLSSNPATLVDLPKIHEKPIIRLEADEIANFLDTVETGAGLTKKQIEYHKRTRVRDLAILTLFLSTGIRISELVGINCSDINFMTNEFTITRKGGNRDTLSFGDEARAALLAYMAERESATVDSQSEGALFLSLQHKRITARAVEQLVKKYAALAVPLKRISPHKLRSTFGTMLYRETGDIYLVADVLGHKDVNTTKKHYAAISEDRRRIAAKAIRLRDEGKD